MTNYYNSIVYSVEYQPYKERFEQHKEDIFNLILSNGYKFKCKEPLTPYEIKGDLFKTTYLQHDNYILSCFNYIFTKNNNIELRINTFQTLLLFNDTSIEELSEEYNILYFIIEHMDKLYKPFNNGTYRMRVGYLNTLITSSEEEIKKIAINDNLDIKYVEFKDGLQLNTKLDTSYANNRILIVKKLIQGQISSNENGYSYDKEVHVYKEDDSAFQRNTFDSYLLNNLTKIIKDISK